MLGMSQTGIPINATVAQGWRGQGWRLPSIRSRCQRMQALRSYLLRNPLPHVTNGTNSFFWKTNDRTTTVFSNRHTWNILIPIAALVHWKKVVWHACHVPKHAFTFWVKNLDRLSVQVRLHAWGVVEINSCCTCGNHSETRNHLLLHYDFSSQIWHLVLRRLGLHALIFHNWSALVTWLLEDQLSTASSKLNRLVFQVTIFMLWGERYGQVLRLIDRSIVA